MRDDVREAIESARSREAPFRGYSPVDGEPTRWHSFDFVRHLFLTVLRELPEYLTVEEIREDLEG